MARKPTKPRTVFGAQLTEARLRLGIDRDDAAKRCGVARSTYASWEIGDRTPPLEKIRKIVKPMRSSLAELCGGVA